MVILVVLVLSWLWYWWWYIGGGIDGNTGGVGIRVCGGIDCGIMVVVLMVILVVLMLALELVVVLTCSTSLFLFDFLIFSNRLLKSIPSLELSSRKRMLYWRSVYSVGLKNAKIILTPLSFRPSSWGVQYIYAPFYFVDIILFVRFSITAWRWSCLWSKSFPFHVLYSFIVLNQGSPTVFN